MVCKAMCFVVGAEQQTEMEHNERPYKATLIMIMHWLQRLPLKRGTLRWFETTHFFFAETHSVFYGARARISWQFVQTLTHCRTLGS